MKHKTWQLILLFLTICFSANCQETYYYRHIKTKTGDKVVLNDDGGQFITFSNGKCYESDHNGYSVENGSLQYKSTENGIINYYGDSYWGKCCFRFTSDKKKLNVVIDDVVLVYEQSEPPKGVTTCSLVKAKTNNDIINWHSQWYTNPYVYTDPNAYQPINPVGSSYEPASSNSSHFEHSQYGQIQCSYCHGTGVCQTCNGKGYYIGGVGLNTLPCPNCDSNHNGKCRICHGTGKVYGRIN